MQYTWLDKIEYPDDLKTLEINKLPLVCNDLRQFIIDVLSKNSGHLGASLGVVELTVALHYVFNLPQDDIVWDVGHQAYGHKILTGRKSKFHTNRKWGGISGFPSMDESKYDSFGAGHSSTSISAAMGIAKAYALKGEKDRHIIAVIGDGSMTGGMAFEALNNAKVTDTNLLVILNDNEMAIDPNVGALKEYFTKITTSGTYNKLKNNVWRSLSYIRPLRRIIQKMETGLKSMLLKQGNLFGSLGIRYFGPVDGHDVVKLTKILSAMRDISGPRLLHVHTIKGKGYTFAEEDQTRFHAPGVFNIETGEKETCDTGDNIPIHFVFGKTLCDLADKNDKILAITPAMGTGSGLYEFKEKFPERFFDVGIAEQHAVTYAAGLASRGMLPFCCIYSSFMQRAYDQAIHDVILQKHPVVLCIDRAGLVGEDGATHQGAYDMSAFRCIPGVTIAAPMDALELRNMMYTASVKADGPFIIRYAKGYADKSVCQSSFDLIEKGRGRKLRDGKDIAVVSLGAAGINASKACDILYDKGLAPAHYDMRFLKPFDMDMIREICSEYRYVVTVEDGSVKGGFGSAFLEAMHEMDCPVNVRCFGIPDKFIAHGTQDEQYRECGIDPESIAENIIKYKRG